MRLALVLLSALTLAAPSRAAEAPLAPASYYALRAEALRLQNSGDRRAAAEAYQRMTRTYDGDGQIWWELAECLRESGRPLDAAEAYRHAYVLGFATRARVAFETARTFARASKPDSAVRWIERALADGFERRSELADDPEFASLRSRPDFQHAAGMLPERTMSRDEGWRFDLDALVGEVKRVHSRFRAEPPPAAFTSGVAALRERIPALSDVGVMLEMQRLMVLLGDGHTTLYPAPGGRVKLMRMPLQLHRFADGLYVVDAPSEQARWIGARIERVGAVSADEALRRVEPYVPRDNDNGPRVMGGYFLSFTTVTKELGITPTDASLPLAGVGADGRPIEGSVAATEVRDGGPPPKLPAARYTGAPEAPPSLRRVGEPYWFEALPGDSVVYVQFNQVMDAGDMAHLHAHGGAPPSGNPESLRQFALRLRRQFDEHPVRAVILDVRQNNGGNSDLLTTLDRTLIHYETTRPGRRMFVITSPFTFSAAQNFIATLDVLTNAIFVGEPSGSRPNFVGEDTPLVLPWSHTHGSISSRVHRVSSADERTWIAPEIPVPSTGADWKAGRDAAMEAVMQVITGARP